MMLRPDGGAQSRTGGVPAGLGPEALRVFADGLEAALTGLCQSARELTDARYAALGVLDRERSELEHFVTSGVNRQTRDRIGAHPRGRGVLGLLLTDPRPLRVDELDGDPRCYGFPQHHPSMRGFLGVPLTIDGVPWGNLYVAEKKSGAFDDSDERIVIAIAAHAAAIVRGARAEDG